MCVTKNAPCTWGNFHACATTKKPQQLGRARTACASIVTSRAQRAWSRATLQRPALLQAATETTGEEDSIAVRRVRHCKEVGLQEWPLTGRATVPRVLYGIGLRMSLRRRTILSKSSRAPARVSLRHSHFRAVPERERQVIVLFGKR